MTLRYDYARLEMLPFISPRAHSILEIGCGSGRFGGELRRRSPTAQLWAIEPDADHASSARAFFNVVIVGTFPDAIRDLGMQRFDAIIFNDVLEHMVDPLRALIAARDLLHEDGQLVASIPNVRHISVVRRLVIRGELTYTERGILDRTHLRFFTRHSISELLMGGASPRGWVCKSRAPSQQSRTSVSRRPLASPARTELTTGIG